MTRVNLLADEGETWTRLTDGLPEIWAVEAVVRD
jgi:hypothetical protein